MRHGYVRPRVISVSEPERQTKTALSSSHKVLKPTHVNIDRKGRLSVKTNDLASSEAFRTRLDGMVKLANTHPPKR